MSGPIGMSVNRVKRRHKFGAIQTEVDGIRFASKREAARYSELRLLLRAGEISDLEIQPKYEIRVNGTKVCSYIADFRYRDKFGLRHVEDAKGVRTDVYKLKKKLAEASYPGLMIEEV